MRTVGWKEFGRVRRRGSHEESEQQYKTKSLNRLVKKILLDTNALLPDLVSVNDLLQIIAC